MPCRLLEPSCKEQYSKATCPILCLTWSLMENFLAYDTTNPSFLGLLQTQDWLLNLFLAVARTWLVAIKFIASHMRGAVCLKLGARFLATKPREPPPALAGQNCYRVSQQLRRMQLRTDTVASISSN